MAVAAFRAQQDRADANEARILALEARLEAATRISPTYQHTEAPPPRMEQCLRGEGGFRISSLRPSTEAAGVDSDPSATVSPWRWRSCDLYTHNSENELRPEDNLGLSHPSVLVADASSASPPPPAALARARTEPLCPSPQDSPNIPARPWGEGRDGQKPTFMAHMIHGVGGAPPTFVSGTPTQGGRRVWSRAVLASPKVQLMHLSSDAAVVEREAANENRGGTMSHGYCGIGEIAQPDQLLFEGFQKHCHPAVDGHTSVLLQRRIMDQGTLAGPPPAAGQAFGGMHVALPPTDCFTSEEDTPTMFSSMRMASGAGQGGLR